MVQIVRHARFCLTLCLGSIMVMLFRNLVFLSFPLALLALGVSIRGIAENPLSPSDTQGLPPVVIYFVILMVIGFISLGLAAAGKLLESKISGAGRLAWAIRLVCFVPLALAASLLAVVSAGYAMSTIGGVIALLLAIVSALSVFFLFPKKN